MVRIQGVTLPDNKRIVIGLTYVFGIGQSLSQKILNSVKVDTDTKVKDLTEDQVNAIRDFIDKEVKSEGELKREVSMHIKRLKDISSYRGIRHNKGLPVRGQKTKTNSRTVRGNVRRTAGSGHKKTAEKT